MPVQAARVAATGSSAGSRALDSSRNVATTWRPPSANAISAKVVNAHRHPLGMAARRTRPRLRDDLLATPARLEHADVWQRLHAPLPAELNTAGKPDLSRAHLR